MQEITATELLCSGLFFCKDYFFRLVPTTSASLPLEGEGGPLAVDEVDFCIERKTATELYCSGLFCNNYFFNLLPTTSASLPLEGEGGPLAVDEVDFCIERKTATELYCSGLFC
ncbi:MAG: hypothetical protein IIY12_02535, partial [Clostridia bacterium]|nr:hypothetical protein [Clostridia bacterium]